MHWTHSMIYARSHSFLQPDMCQALYKLDPTASNQKVLNARFLQGAVTLLQIPGYFVQDFAKNCPKILCPSLDNETYSHLYHRKEAST